MAALAGGDALADPVLDSYAFAPMVARSDRTEPLVLSTHISGDRPDRVVLAPLQGAEIDLRDDGLGADRTANDRVYSASVPASLAVDGLRPEDVHRKHVGYLDVYAGGRRTARINVLSQVWSPEMGLADPVRIDDAVQYSGHVVNVVDPAVLAAGVARDYYAGPRTIVRKVLQSFADDADFASVVFNTNYVANRYHVNVSNFVKGIGMEVRDGSAEYGSDGRLIGFNVFPAAGFFDAGGDGQSHEVGHQWVSQLLTPLLFSGRPHWPLSSMASGLMGYNLAGGVGGNFPCKLVPVANGVQLQPRDELLTFGELDLYVMGLLPASEVPDQLVFADQSAAAAISSCGATMPMSAFKTVSIADVIATNGRREPGVAEAQRDYRLLVAVVSDAPLSREEMAFYDFFAARADATTPHLVREGLRTGAGSPFNVATHGKARLSTPVPRLRKATADAPGALTGTWWNSARPGQGVTVAQRGDVLFVALYTYGADGKPTWLVASDCRGIATTTGNCTGALYRQDGGGPLSATGTLRASFGDANNAVLEYTVDGRSETMAVTRFGFDTGAAALPVDYTDLWWDPGYPGTGVQVTQQGKTMFVVWFRADAGGKGTWYFASSCAVTSSGCEGRLYRTTFAAGASEPVASEVGTLRLEVAGPNSARMIYTLDGQDGRRVLTRFVF